MMWIAAVSVVGFLLALAVVTLNSSNTVVAHRLSPLAPATTAPTTTTSTTTNSTTPPTPAPPKTADLTQWQAFGGIDHQFGDGGSSVVLDTHDSVWNWSSKWSGLIAPGDARCSVHIHARVRDISHANFVPGGYAIGLAELDSPGLAKPTLRGWAVQYDFGQNGYRTTTYPGDTEVGRAPGPLDHRWHVIDLSVDGGGVLTQTVDGTTVVHQSHRGGCGKPVFRVWAGAAEFADVAIN
jgi:hypothetical protein